MNLLKLLPLGSTNHALTETFRDNELVSGGLKPLDTTSIGGYQAFYNYIKKHVGFG